jgi:hypothetical protein
MLFNLLIVDKAQMFVFEALLVKKQFNMSVQVNMAVHFYTGSKRLRPDVESHIEDDSHKNARDYHQHLHKSRTLVCQCKNTNNSGHSTKSLLIN